MVKSQEHITSFLSASYNIAPHFDYLSLYGLFDPYRCLSASFPHLGRQKAQGHLNVKNDQISSIIRLNISKIQS